MDDELEDTQPLDPIDDEDQAPAEVPDEPDPAMGEIAPTPLDEDDSAPADGGDLAELLRSVEEVDGE